MAHVRWTYNAVTWPHNDAEPTILTIYYTTLKSAAHIGMFHYGWHNPAEGSATLCSHNYKELHTRNWKFMLCNKQVSNQYKQHLLCTLLFSRLIGSAWNTATGLSLSWQVNQHPVIYTVENVLVCKWHQLWGLLFDLLLYILNKMPPSSGIKALALMAAKQSHIHKLELWINHAWSH